MSTLLTDAQNSARREALAKLNHLKRLVGALPSTIPAGSPDGPIARYFGDLTSDADEGPWYAIDRAWLRFSGPGERDEGAALQRSLWAPTGLFLPRVLGSTTGYGDIIRPACGENWHSCRIYHELVS